MSVDPPGDYHVHISGDRKFLTLTPRSPLTPDAGGEVHVTITGRYLVDPDREGLKLTGGSPGGDIEESFTFSLRPPRTGPFPLPIPQSPGDDSGVLELYRLAAPLPTILPSYNQIGFDSLHYLLGFVEGDDSKSVVWVVGARLAEGKNATVVDPETTVMFPMEVSYDEGLISFTNEAGFSLEVMSATIPFDTFRITARLDENGDATDSARVHVTTICAELSYGAFLQALGFCNPQSDLLTVFGAAEIRPHDGGIATTPAGLGDVTFSVEDDRLKAKVENSSLLVEDHVLGLLLIDASTGSPVNMDYAGETERKGDNDGNLTEVSIPLENVSTPVSMRAHLMVDTYPADATELVLP